jgi:hypothetical protein
MPQAGTLAGAVQGEGEARALINLHPYVLLMLFIALGLPALLWMVP